MDVIEFMNPHWEQGFSYDYYLKRDLFSMLVKQLSHPLAVSIKGPRRVGKTVMLKQLINYLIKQGYPRTNILYFSFDDESIELIQLVKEWKKMVGKNIRGQTFFLLLDEIQNIKDWPKSIKMLYDNLNIKIFLTGSSSLDIAKGMGMLAGRILSFELMPLTFKEYKTFSGNSDYTLYLSKQLPDLALGKAETREYIKSIVEKVIYYDIPKHFDVESSEKIESMFKIIAKEPGSIIKISDLAKDFGISRPTVAKYLKALEDSFLVRKLYNFSRNARKVEIRAKKFYPYYTTLCYYAFPEFSKLIETEVAFKTNAEFFLNDRGKEIDFIVGNTAIEVKIRNRVDSSDVLYLKKSKFKKKVVVCKPNSKVNVKGIEVIPYTKIDEFSANLKTKLYKNA